MGTLARNSMPRRLLVLFSLLLLMVLLATLSLSPTTKGLELVAATEDGKTVTMRIASEEVDRQDTAAEVHLYTVEWRDTANPRWRNLCQPDRQGQRKAMALAGQWDTKGNFLGGKSPTFACTSGALAKCVRFGYKPWKSVGGKSLRAYHQACTRLVKADYFGDGRTHTYEGTPIELYDLIGVRSAPEAISSQMPFEAAFDPDGATCIARARWHETISQLRRQCRSGRPCPVDPPCHNSKEAARRYPNSLIFVNSRIQPEVKNLSMTVMAPYR
jgi:hypothetical protein